MVSTNIHSQSNKLIELAIQNELFAVASKILQKEGDTMQEADERLRTFFKALTISANEPGKYAFHEYEDKAFHACLLDNEAFEKVCLKIFGFKVNHMSWARLGDDMFKYQDKADKMISKFTELFGKSKMLSEGSSIICWDSPAVAA